MRPDSAEPTFALLEKVVDLLVIDLEERALHLEVFVVSLLLEFEQILHEAGKNAFASFDFTAK